MGQNVMLTAAHWWYLLGVLAIVVTMIFRANVVVPAVLGTLLVAWAWTGSALGGVTSVFNASLVAAKELFNIFLVIALMTALLNSLKALGADVRMVQPFRTVMSNGTIAYFVLALVTYLISLFFWPTPAVPLVGAILIPAAIAAGLSPMGTAVAVAIAGQGMALSSDYVIKVAPGISAKAAGLADLTPVADRALALSLITGLVALVLGYLMVRREIQAPSQSLLDRWTRGESLAAPPSIQEAGSFDMSALAQATAGERKDDGTWGAVFAIVTPLVFLGVVALMVLPRFVSGMPDLKGGDAAALVGGAAGVLLLLSSLAAGRARYLDRTADHVTDGLVFAFRAMGSVLPIAGFFFIGAPETAAAIVGTAAGAKPPNLLFELIQAGQAFIPQNQFFVAFGTLIVGMITGIDGSGFSGLPLTGALSGALGKTVGMDPATLAAVGQMGAVWTGGGTLVAWSSLIAVTGFARVPVLDAVRVLFLPVIAGLIISTIAAVMLW